MISDPSDLRIELGYLRDNIAQAVREHKVAFVEEGLAVYEELVISFIEKLKKYDATYTRDRALQESNSWGGGWSEIQWAVDDLRELMGEALRANNLPIIRLVLNLPMTFVQVAFHDRDYYVYHNFLRWLTHSYRQAVDAHFDSLPSFVERMWRRLKEIGNYIVLPAMTDADSVSDLTRAHEFAIGLVLGFNDLLRATYDTRRVQDFRAFAGALRTIFDHYDSLISRIDSERHRIAYQLGDPKLPVEQRHALELLASIRSKHREVRDDIKDRIDLVFYGLAAWVIRKYLAGKLTVAECVEWWKETPPPQSLGREWTLAIRATNRVTAGEFRWEWWEMDDQPEGVGYVASFDVDTARVFCLRTLQLLGEMPSESHGDVRLGPTGDLLQRMEGNNQPLLSTILEALEREPDRWVPIVGPRALATIPVLKEVLANARALQKESETARLIEAPLTITRIAEVKRNIVKNWEKSTALRWLMKTHGRYNLFPDSAPDGLYYGFNQLDRKDVYVESSGVSVSGWGEHYGASLGESENEIVLRKLLRGLSECPERVREQDLDPIRGALSDLRSARYSPILIVLNSWRILRSIEEAREFRSVQDSPTTKLRLVGYFDGRPVFSLYFRGSPTVALVDIRRNGVWKQYVPKKVLLEEEMLTPELSFAVKAIDQAAAEELVARNRNLLLDDQGRERSKDDVVLELQQRVQFRLVEQFEYESIDSNAGFLFPLDGSE